MATSYPTAIDTFVDPTSGTPLDAPAPLAHSVQHQNINDAMAAVQTFVGRTGHPGSAVTATSVLYGPAPSGDTTGATDGAAINAAQAAMSTAGGGVLILRQGGYWSNIAIVCYSNVELEIPTGTTITQAAGANLYRFIWNHQFSSGQDTNIKITGGGLIDGNGANQTTTSLGINFANVAGVEIRCEVQGCWSEGVYLSGCSNVRLDLNAHDCSRDGIVLGALASTTTLAVSAVTFVSSLITITVPSTTTLTVGAPIVVSGITGFTTFNPNGQYVVNTIPSSTTFTCYAQEAPTGTYGSGGTVALATMCSDVVGNIRTSRCGLTATTTIGATSDGQTLPQGTIYAAATIPQGVGHGLFDPAGGTINVVAAAPVSGILMAFPITYTGITADHFTGCTGGTGTMAAGGLIGLATRSGMYCSGVTDFDLTVHSFDAGLEGIDAAGGGTKRGRLVGVSARAGRFGCYIGLGPVDIEADIRTTGSGLGGFGGEYTLPTGDVIMRGISDGDSYGVYFDTCTGFSFEGVVKNAQKDGVVLSGSDHCVVDLKHGYNNGLSVDNTYSDVHLVKNTGSAHPASNTVDNDVRIGVSHATASAKVTAALVISDTTDTFNRWSIGAIDGAHNSTVQSGTSIGTRNFPVQSGFVNPSGMYSLGSTMNGAVAIDPRNGGTQAGTISGNVTALTILNGFMVGATMTLILTQNGTGGFTVTFSGANWRIGSYAMTATASKRDVLNFVWDGTVWNLASVQQAL